MPSPTDETVVSCLLRGYQHLFYPTVAASLLGGWEAARGDFPFR
ncbi:MAG TPA: hypothetical protein VKF63_03745 [Terracidiphilus sp.]|nr:hypothetical protein [Terracidiphilus sp.]